MFHQSWVRDDFEVCFLGGTVNSMAINMPGIVWSLKPRTTWDESVCLLFTMKSDILLFGPKVL